jgi:hypothetical protein
MRQPILVFVPLVGWRMKGMGAFSRMLLRHALISRLLRLENHRDGRLFQRTQQVGAAEHQATIAAGRRSPEATLPRVPSLHKAVPLAPALEQAMSVTVTVAVIVLVAALLLGLLYAALRRGKIGRTPAIVLAMIIILLGGVTILYPSVMIVEQEITG